MVEEPTRWGVLLDFVLSNWDELVKDVKLGGSLGCSNHEMVEFKILYGRTKATRAKKRIATLDVWRINFNLFQDLCGGISWATVIEAGQHLSSTSKLKIGASLRVGNQGMEAGNLCG